MANDDIYYAHAGRLPFARRLSRIARIGAVRRVLEILAPTESTTVLDIGTADETAIESNMLQQLYPYPQRLTCAGLSDGSSICRAYPGVNHVQIQPGEPLPFENDHFTCAYSNAVIEHCGDRAKQAFFLAELCRVSKSQFLIAPNPWFPVEHHTGLPLVHFLPKKLFRYLLSKTRWSHWADERNLNYISKNETVRIWPGGLPKSEFCGIGAGVLSSNFLVYQHTSLK